MYRCPDFSAKVWLRANRQLPDETVDLFPLSDVRFALWCAKLHQQGELVS